MLQYFPSLILGLKTLRLRLKKVAGLPNASFSPLEVGKQWCYSELRRIVDLTAFDGYEDTYLTRQALGLKKSKDKLSNRFNAHCVDSWTLAYLLVGGDSVPNNTVVMECKPIRIYRRQLHVFNPGSEWISSSLWRFHVSRIEAWWDCQTSQIWQVLCRWRRL